MSRLPFDPGKMASPRPLPGGALFSGQGEVVAPRATSAAQGAEQAQVSAAAAGDAPITVAQLAAMIDATLRDHLPQNVRVIGEISNFTLRTHWYFSLKEAQVNGGVINCVMFAGRTRGVGFVPSEGQQVIVTGRVEYYKPQGKVSFYVERIEPVGAGAMELAFRALCDELRKLGYFAPERKRPLPSFPRRIAVITSRTGAALQDVLNTARRRCPAVEIALIDVLVQGAQAAPEVARAIRWVSANHARLGVDAVLVTRGGGSMEDLWAFNERVVAEAVYACEIPVACAIGHETDTTIAELVADERCATPTQAAMRLTPDRAELGEQLEMLKARVSTAARRRARQEAESLTSDRRHLLPVLKARMDGEGRRLGALGARLERCRPTTVLHQRALELARLGARAAAAIKAKLEGLDLGRESERLGAAVKMRMTAEGDGLLAMRRQLDLVGPLSVLARGYSMTLDEYGHAVRRVSDVEAGQVITTRVQDGAFASVVGRVGGGGDVPRKIRVRGEVGGGAVEGESVERVTTNDVRDVAERVVDDAANVAAEVQERVKADVITGDAGSDEVDGGGAVGANVGSDRSGEKVESAAGVQVGREREEAGEGGFLSAPPARKANKPTRRVTLKQAGSTADPARVTFTPGPEDIDGQLGLF